VRALDFEVYSGLPERIARVDQRVDDFHKSDAHCHLHSAGINSACPGELRLYSSLPNTSIKMNGD
jgi:hypothetical protein